MDADGFATVAQQHGRAEPGRRRISTAQSFMYTQAPLPADQRDMVPDFNDFEGGPLPVPNGVVQIHLQTVYGDPATLIDDWEVKAAADRQAESRSAGGCPARQPERHQPAVRRAVSEHRRRSISAARNTSLPLPISFHDSIKAGFTNLVINTTTDSRLGGFGIFQSAASTVFDGTNATMEIRAQADRSTRGWPEPTPFRWSSRIRTATARREPGDFGGDEYHFDIDLNQFNTSTYDHDLDSA